MERKKILAYYFPNWHVDKRNEQWHGKGWTEWSLVKCAIPRFPGHHQPKVPLWGYEDEAEPQVMEKKISTAHKYGIDGFLFDWYFYADGPYRNRCLDEGLLHASNLSKIKFAVMWCNHDAIQAHPASRTFPIPVLCSGTVDAETFRRATQYCIDHYFSSPSYLREKGKLFFSIYSLPKMVNELGGLRATRELFNDFRARVEAAHLGELHLNAINLENIDAPAITPSAKVDEITSVLGLDSRAGHAWTWDSPDFPTREYALVAESNMAQYAHYSKDYQLPYNPPICVGWDSTPRIVASEVFEKLGYPFSTVLANSTPAQFEKVLRNMKAFMESENYTGDFLMLHSWNEWTEGTYLEPDAENGYGYLEAVLNTFGPVSHQ